ncbi:hypothetical protein ALC60_13964, partial [Trachymyrmex zeteki]
IVSMELIESVHKWFVYIIFFSKLFIASGLLTGELCSRKIMKFECTTFRTMDFERMIWVYLKARLKHRISHFFVHLMALHADKVSCACHILNGYYARMGFQTIRHFNVSDTPLVISLAKSNIPGFSSGKYNRALILNGASVE